MYEDAGPVGAVFAELRYREAPTVFSVIIHVVLNNIILAGERIDVFIIAPTS
jgi:hypothetical protein